MRVLVIGADGYIGWPLCRYLEARGYTVFSMDSYIKRTQERRLGITPLLPLSDRLQCGTWEETTLDEFALYEIVDKAEPDAVVHLGEQPSAPLSMLSRGWAYATQENNVLGTLNLIFAAAHAAKRPHIIKLGTMGEYGTPNIPIEEGWLDLTHKGHTDRVLFPKKPGSWYHASKVHDSANLEYACRVWGLQVTDLNQGVVWGLETDECPPR